MATVEEIARDVLASHATDANAALVARWMNNRYRELVSKVKFRHLRNVGELSLPAVINTGTITVTRGSTAVAGAATTFETEVGSGTQEHYYFRTRTAWYRIASITDETNLVLESAFAEDDVSAGSYYIVKRTHSIATDGRWVGDFYHTRLRRRLSLVSLDELDALAPGRTLVAHYPLYIAQIGVDSSGYGKYEIYAPPANSEIINYIYWKIPSSLTLSTTFPLVIDPYVIKEGVLVDLYRYNMSIEAKKGNVEVAALWRNESRTQDTTWKRAIKDAIRTSRGADDISIILDMRHGLAHRSADQRTARDYVYDNWRQ